MKRQLIVAFFPGDGKGGTPTRGEQELTVLYAYALARDLKVSITMVNKPSDIKNIVRGNNDTIVLFVSTDFTVRDSALGHGGSADYNRIFTVRPYQDFPPYDVPNDARWDVFVGSSPLIHVQEVAKGPRVVSPSFPNFIKTAATFTTAICPIQSVETQISVSFSPDTLEGKEWKAVASIIGQLAQAKAGGATLRPVEINPAQGISQAISPKREQQHISCHK